MLSFFESYFNHFSTERNTILHDSVNIMALHLPYWVIPSNKLTGFCEKFGHCCDNLSSVYHTNLEGFLAEVHHMTKINQYLSILSHHQKPLSTVITAGRCILDGQNASFQGRTLTNDQLHEIEEYLRAIEVIAYGHVRYIRKEPVPDRPIILTQPGMCYCQALALIHSLINDPLFDHMDDAEKNIAIERLDNEIKEEIMVEIVQLATMRKRRGCDVFKLVFDEGEYDMVVYDHKSQTCQLYTIKHSEKMAGEQVRYLVNADMLKQTAERIAPIAERCVVYLGPDAIDDNGVRYLNVDNYLSIL